MLSSRIFKYFKVSSSAVPSGTLRSEEEKARENSGYVQVLLRKEEFHI
jgi:hypothetical protein